MTTQSKPAATVAKKSGLRQLKAGEVLFNDGDPASSLYIIQKGQLRLYKPKGKGFIELAVLRAGEVIGEMAYFDDEGSGRRSCAAAALIPTDIIEISFVAFGKTMEGLNPWFKTIINTLATRLRKTNARVKELESNSMAAGYGAKAVGYEFIKNHELVKILGTLFLVYKSHGEKHPQGFSLHRKTLDLYLHDIYGIIESKSETVLELLKDLGYTEIENDEDGLPKILVIKSLEFLRALFIFYNTEKHLTDDKKLTISFKCQSFLERIYSSKKMDPSNKKMTQVPIQTILDDYKNRNISITLDDLADAHTAGITGEVIVTDDQGLVVEVLESKLMKLMPIITFINALKKLNESKQ
jgi:CRP-like cAMP-binding protein